MKPPRIRLQPASQKNEAARCAFLHALCGEIEAATARGITRKTAVARAARRQRVKLFARGHLSRVRLTRLFSAWRKVRLPEVFRRHYKPGRPHIPASLVLDFLNRMAGERVVSAAGTMRSLRNDWQMGHAIPGLGTWSDYERRTRGESSRRTAPPEFPFSYRTFCRYLAPKAPDTYAQRIAAALRAQRELDRFMHHIETRRGEIEARTAHEPMAKAHQK